MKVIFLDIDGVLNSEAFSKESHKIYLATGEIKPDVDEKAVQRLQTVIKATGAKIVLSSSWRNEYNRVKTGESLGVSDDILELIRLFKKYDLEVISAIPNEKLREDGILKWLKLNKDIDKFVIVDDENVISFKGISPYFVQTDYYGEESGLQDSHVDTVIELLNTAKVF